MRRFSGLACVLLAVALIFVPQAHAGAEKAGAAGADSAHAGNVAVNAGAAGARADNAAADGGSADGADNARKSARGMTVRVYFENDLFYNADRDYTNAVQLRVIGPDLRSLAEDDLLPSGLGALLGDVPFPGYRGAVQYSLSAGGGQHIYTPVDTDARTLQKHDRPYAGYLYGMLALHAKRYNRLDTLELALGVIGPSALAGQAQNEVHRLRGFRTAKGWQHQLRDEPALMLTWSRVWRLNEKAQPGGWGWDVLPLFSASAGTPFTRAGVGTEFRFGWNPPPDFGSSTIRPGAGIPRPLERGAPVPSRESFWDGFSLYAFAGGDGYAVARNSFLDGNLWKDSHSVDAFPCTGELYGGVATIISDFQITYTHVYRSREFHGGRDHNYGSITIGYRF